MLDLPWLAPSGRIYQLANFLRAIPEKAPNTSAITNKSIFTGKIISIFKILNARTWISVDYWLMKVRGKSLLPQPEMVVVLMQAYKK